jgi:hypothetical protein
MKTKTLMQKDTYEGLKNLNKELASKNKLIEQLTEGIEINSENAYQKGLKEQAIEHRKLLVEYGQQMFKEGIKLTAKQIKDKLEEEFDLPRGTQEKEWNKFWKKFGVE